KNPGVHSFGSPGTGSIGHLMMEMFMLATGTQMQHVPYRGSGPALNDAVAGQIPLIFDNFPSALPFIQSKRLTPLVVAAPQRLAVLPNVPTLAEVGAPGVNRMAYYGIVGPKGTPKEVVDKVNKAVHKVLQDPAIRKRIEDTGSLIVADTPEKFAQEIKAEYTAYKEVVDKQKLTMD
ncbi:MAG: tripartite tricarboxylate transporter substrate-binding protein, partial [Comamonas sp.]